MARLLGGPGRRVEAEEWLRQAVAAAYGVASLHDLDRQTRAVAFQKASGVLIALCEHDGDLAFEREQRRIVQEVFARFFGGHLVDGPAWRLGPDEDLPSRAEYEEAADFAAAGAA